MTWQREQAHELRHINDGERVSERDTGRAPAASRRRRRMSAPASRTGKTDTPSSKAKAARTRGGKLDAAKRDHEGYLIKELQHLLRGQIEARMRARGLWLSFPHSAVLMTLSEAPGLSGAQLSRHFSVTAQTMNGLLLPLEEKGLIERVPDPENARVLKCYLKPKGVDLMQRGMQEAGAVFDQMLGNLSARERDEFRSILRRCIDALQRVEARDK